MGLVSGLFVAEIKAGSRLGSEDSGDPVERVVSESGEPAGQGSTSAFRESGAIDKGVRNVIGRFHVCHF